MSGVLGWAIALVGLFVFACAPAAPAPAAQPAKPAAQPAAPAPEKPAAPVEKPAAPAAKPAAPAQPAKPAAKPAAVVPKFVSDPQVYEAAKKEGNVVWMCAEPQANCDGMSKRFEEATGIKVEVTRLPAGVQIDRVLRERQAGLKVTDVIEHGLPPGFADFKQRGLFQPHVPREHQQKIGPEYRDKDGMFSAGWSDVGVIIYNAKLISAAEAPKAWKDMYEPKWKGKVGLGDPKTVGTANAYLLWQSKLYGWGFLQKLAANQPRVTRTLVEGVPLVIGGELPVYSGIHTSAVWESIKKGEPIGIAYPEDGAIVVPQNAAVLKDAPHPNAAKVLLDHLFSLENLQWQADRGTYVAHPDVNYQTSGMKPLKDFKTLVTDAAELSRELDNVRKRFAEAFGG